MSLDISHVNSVTGQKATGKVTVLFLFIVILSSVNLKKVRKHVSENHFYI